MDVIPTEKIDASEVTAMNSMMSDEFQRFQTFKNWPKSHIISPSSLAQAGLYYLNRDDYVQCVFCLVTMNNWVLGDNAIEEHDRHSPNCSFIIQISNRYKCIKCIHVMYRSSFSHVYTSLAVKGVLQRQLTAQFAENQSNQIREMWLRYKIRRFTTKSIRCTFDNGGNTSNQP